MFDRVVWHLRTWGLLALGALVGTGLLVYWQSGFTADRALLGVFATSVVSRGESLLFLFKVAYQGMLLEGSLLALSVRLLGPTPIALFLPNAFLFLVSAWVFYRFLKAHSVPGVAEIGTAFILTLSPLFLNLAARPHPNLTSTFLLGTLQFWIYLQAQGHAQRHARGERGYWVLLGVLSGFGFYTFALTLMFSATLITDAIFRSVFSSPQSTKGETIRRLFAPALAGSSQQPLKALSIAFSAVGGVALLATSAAPDPVRVFALSSAAFLGAHLMSVDRPRALAGTLSLIGLGFALGVSPKVFGYFLYDGLYSSRATVGGSWADLAQRIGVWWECAGVLVGYLPLALALAATATSKGQSPGMRLWTTLLGVSSVGFILSNNPIDVTSARYLLPAAPAVAALLGSWGVALRGGTRRPWAQKLLALALVGAFIFGVFNLSKDFRDSHMTSDAKKARDIAAYLEAQNVFEGYSYYWFAYTVSYLTRERIVLEPLQDPYNPHYAVRVARAERVAWIEKDGRPGPVPPGLAGAVPLSETRIQDAVIKVFVKTGQNRSER